MTDPAEKNALVNFLGTMFGQASALDKAIVNSTKDMRPTSDMFKPILAEVIQQTSQPSAAVQEYVPHHEVLIPEQQLRSPVCISSPDKAPLQEILTSNRNVDKVVSAINELNDTLKIVVKLVNKVLPKNKNGRKKAIHIETPGIREVPTSDIQD